MYIQFKHPSSTAMFKAFNNRTRLNAVSPVSPKGFVQAFRCENEFKRSNRFLPVVRKNNLRHVVFIRSSTVLRLVRPKNGNPPHHARFYPHFRVCKTKRNTYALFVRLNATFVRLNAKLCKTKRNTPSKIPLKKQKCCVYFYN